VEHPALEGDGSHVEVETRRRMTAGERRRRVPTDQMALLGETEPDTVISGG
jgi:hypothetical protein